MEKISLFAELKTLLWLQWKLTLSMFRSRRMTDMARLLRLLLVILQAVFTFPVFLAMGAALGVGLALLSPRAAVEVTLLVNIFLTFIWLLLPSSYSSQMVERFEMSRLFPYPISFRGIVVGSTLASMLTITGVWTIPLMLGEIVGLAWHAPLVLPLIVLGAIPTFALLVLTGRIIDDVFDLVSNDRRLRTLLLFLLSLPFILIFGGQYYLQYVTDNFEQLPAFLSGTIFTELEQAGSISEFLEILRPSRFLAWLPISWPSAAMALPVTAAWGQALLFLVLSFVFVAGLLWGHSQITRRLMMGSTLTLGAERVRTRRWNLNLPGPGAFWALFRKDWLYLQRSPIPKRLIFSVVFMTVSMFFSFKMVPASEFPDIAQGSIAMIGGAFLLVLTGMMSNMVLAANYFGTIDREGFGSLTTSPIDRRYILLSSNLTVILFSMTLQVLPFLVIAILSRALLTLPLLIYMGICLQVSSLPVYAFASIVGPYRASLKFSTNNQVGNLWGLLAWIVGTPPVLLLILLPYFLWPPALLVTLPLSALYSAGLYLLTLKPLSKLLLKREHVILETVISD